MKKIALLLVLIFPLVMHALDQHFYIAFATRVLIYAMAAASLNLVLGYGGMVSFGHAAFFGAGAYVVGIFAAEGVRSLWIAWPAAILVAALAALLIGAISLRTRGVYFIMITLAFAQMMYYVFVSMKAYGGDDGLSMPGRSTGLGLELRNDFVWYYLVLALLIVILYLLHRLLRSRFGRVIEAIRENETRATAIGYPVYRYQLLCFVISGAIAGLAGALIANQTSYVGPALLHWVQSGTLMIMVILGGVGRFWGGPVGAAVLLALEELFSGSPLLGAYSLHWQLPVGIILLAVVLFAPRESAVLSLKNVSKRFGGVVAVDAVSLDVRAGEVHALIGPNGAGKTTLIGLISGTMPGNSGEILFFEKNLTRAKPHTRVAAGLARSYQITSIFKRFSVLDNLALAVQARTGSSFKFWKPVELETALFDEARSIAGEVGLSQKLSAVGMQLSHGEQRALEVGLALATRPKLVLLDEPMAGMGPEESQHMIALIARIRAQVTVLLVEHDMDAVFRLADRISVMVNGRLIATGAPNDIRNHPEVRKAYLGDELAA